MLRVLITLLVVCFSTSVEARRHAHHPYHHSHRYYHTTARYTLDLVTIQTAANKRIVVARRLATRFQKLIEDLVAAGYHPRSIHCFSLTGHVAHSRHHVGAACDFDGSLSRNAFMRSPLANRIIVRNRFRNGCTFYSHGVRDCGHVDDGKLFKCRGHRW